MRLGTFIYGNILDMFEKKVGGGGGGISLCRTDPNHLKRVK